jgi:hypothetical protein
LPANLRWARIVALRNQRGAGPKEHRNYTIVDSQWAAQVTQHSIAKLSAKNLGPWPVGVPKNQDPSIALAQSAAVMIRPTSAGARAKKESRRTRRNVAAIRR